MFRVVQKKGEVLCNLQQIGMVKDIPAFFHMGAVPKGWKLLLMSLG
jgi:hypothetical protein